MIDVGGREQTVHGPIAVAPLAPDLRVGTRLAGYRLDAVVGRGGMGIVYRAEHVHLRRPVALKVLGPELAGDAGFRERFLRESRIAASLQHANIVTVYDAGETDGLLYIAMQYIDGGDLGDLLEREGALEPARALAILRQIADALDAAHATGIVHRDVKPGNVLIDARRCYLTDFGLTRRVESQSALTAKGAFVGTVDYMPPEQIEGGVVDARADVYALGCVLYHALTGSVPFRKDSEVSVIYAHLQEDPPSVVARRSGLPPGLDGVIGKALAKRPAERYGTCGELVAAAVETLGGGPRPAATPALPVAALRRVLVADTDSTTRALVRFSLAEGSFEVLEADDGKSALALARGEQPDVLLVGWTFDGAPGADLCRAVRAAPELRETKVVAVTARADSVGEREARAAGFDGRIRKPFSSLQLLNTLNELLDGADSA